MNSIDSILCIVIRNNGGQIMSLLVNQLGRILFDVAVKVTVTVATAYLTETLINTTSKKRQTRRR